MYLLYADESGSTGTDLDNKEQPIFVLGGLIIKDTKWHEANNYFNTEKIKICPLLKDIEIHANELFNSSKKSIFDKFNWKENLEIMESLIDLIISLDISFDYIAIDKKSFKKSANNYFKNTIKINPYFYSFKHLYDKVSSKIASNNDNGIIFLDEIISIPEALYQLYPIISEDNTTMIEKAMFIKSHDTNFIQIADIFSFYTNKYFCIKNGYKKYSDIKENHCINTFNKLFSKTNYDKPYIINEYVPNYVI